MLRVGHAALRPRVLDALGLTPERRDRVDRLLDLLSRHRIVFEPPRTGVDRPSNAPEGPRDPATHPDAPYVVGELRRALLRLTPDVPEFDDAAGALVALERAFSQELDAANVKDTHREALLGLTWSAASLSELADTVRPLLPDADTALPEALGHIDDCLSDLEPLVLRFSLGMVRGLGYYTGITFEVDVPALGPDVCQVAGGGRYDNVVAALGGPSIPAAGFALGLERLLAALHLMQGDALHLQLTPPEPLLLCFSEDPGDREMIATLAHQIKAEGACAAIHPEPVPKDNHAAFLQALEALPGAPYRYVILAEGGALHLASIFEDGAPAPTDLETLLLMFTQREP
ncbi:MAG: hypothetical protein CMH57_03590 [Myxococcales bacterium]|nr:hypothetical protein [Myxococcales bacterium]